MPGQPLTPEEIGAAMARAAGDTGWVAAKTGPDGAVRDWAPGAMAVWYAACAGATATWVSDPDGCELEVASPGDPTVRFRVRQSQT